jgi:hypothetical protein
MEGFGIDSEKDFKMKFESFQKEKKCNLGLINKNMHAMKCNLSNYSKISYRYLGAMR